MAEAEPTRSPIHETDREEKWDSDLEDEDEVIARGYYRKGSSLKNRLKRPFGLIMCMKVQSVKDLHSLERKVRWQARGDLESKKLWFRGLTMNTLKSTLAFFAPEVNAEFGSGFYTADSLKCGLAHVRTGAGAIMVFKDPAFMDSSIGSPVWTNGPFGWLGGLPFHGQLPTTQLRYSMTLRTSFRDLSVGRILILKEKAVLSSRNSPQLVAVSNKGCQILADSLDMIIFVGPK
ncbi:uncharacterized protein KD926_004733 [Aspergillus affinis]|uniref:uncharacterized protein n=1 Tax=Aspergillus affinis TaxID=1070780 RepID=UPI0022FF4558|nr:uncharacterized protein KD926_004733 [Aspergillus affinis]KAI9042942.1 hypothetical protein KD926_004733 [Aspergillus affinis]